MSAETKLTMIRGPTMVVLVGIMNRCCPTSRSLRTLKAENRYRGIGGPLNVSLITGPNPISTAAIEAAVQLGFSRNDEPV
jgi:hypothetical protein